ncbi:MAG TPA: pyridoxal phosphate-dependent aminotransferase [Candidatus Eisenbacteria bacterium]|nr:pyridoxal phosphate-dependent aminotransferase [Candidatus Eisenbacteria bacterium]
MSRGQTAETGTARHRVSARVRALKPSETLALSARARELRARGERVVSFAAGEPDFDTPVHIQDAAVEAIRAGHHRYTDVGGVPALRSAIAEKLRKDNGVAYGPREVVVSNGAKHSIWNALFSLLEPGDEVLIPVPYWVSFPEMVRLCGGEPVFVAPARGGLKVSAEDLERAATPRSRALILNSPNNPSGAVYAREEIEAIADLVRRRDLMVVSDEIYERLVYGAARHVSIASFGEEARARTVLVNGVSKTWAMTGWRIGYAAAPAEIAEAMERLQGQSTSNPSSVSQQAALKAITGDDAPAQAMKARFEARRDLAVERIGRMKGVRLAPPEGAFYVFPDFSERIAAARNGVATSAQLCDYLIDEAKVVCVPGAAFGMEGHVRISYAVSEKDLEEGLDRIAAALERM